MGRTGWQKQLKGSKTSHFEKTEFTFLHMLARHKSLCRWPLSRKSGPRRVSKVCQNVSLIKFTRVCAKRCLGVPKRVWEGKKAWFYVKRCSKGVLQKVSKRSKKVRKDRILRKKWSRVCTWWSTVNGALAGKNS